MGMDDASLFSPTISQPPPPPPPLEKDHFLKRDNASVNAVSFGFVATAVLISMFLVMAIFERFLRPRTSFSPVSSLHDRESDVSEAPATEGSLKRDDTTVEYSAGVSVLMPGQEIPTFIAKPVPIPCPREGVSWPCHVGSCSFDVRPISATSGKTQGELTGRPQVDPFGPVNVEASSNNAV